MAFVRRPVTRVTYTLRDQQKAAFASFHLTTVTGNVLPDINAAPVQTFLGEFADNLQAVSDCFVESFSVTTEWENDVAPVFGAAADVERKAVLQFKTEDGFYSIFTIPGAKYDMFDAADGVQIVRPDNSGSFAGNTLETPLESIHDKLRNGVTNGAVTHASTDRRAKDLRNLWDAYKQHRSNPRG